MKRSQELTVKGFYDQLDQFSDFWVQKRVFNQWKEHFVETKIRIQKIIQSMDLNEKWILQYHLNHWKQFVLIQHEKIALKLRRIQLAKRVVRQWRSLVARNKILTKFKYFSLLRRYYVQNKIENVIRERNNQRVLYGYFQHMKDYSIHSYQREIRMHEKCILMHRRNLKKKYFNFLKLSAKIKHDVEYMRSTALESRRFYMFKAFFQPWKEITQKRKINRYCYHILKQQQDFKQKSQIFYKWIHSSIKNYQVRVFEEKNLLQKCFKVLQQWYLKQSKKNYQLDYIKNKKTNGLKKMIMLVWFQYANKKVTRERRCLAYLMKQRQMVLERSFNAFKQIVSKQIRKERLLYFSMKHYQVQLLSKCFGVWSVFLDSKQRFYLNKLEALRHSEKMLQRLYFKTMKNFIFKKKFLRDVEAQIELRKISRDKQTIFQFMKHRLSQSNLIGQKIVERYIIKHVSSVFEKFREITKKQRFLKQCVTSNKSKIENRLKERVLKAWARRSNEHRLPRYQKQDAKLMKETKLYRKSFKALKSRWICRKNGKFIEQNKQLALQRNAFYLWSFLKVQEERINRNIIGMIVNRQYRMFYYWKDHTIRSKKQKSIINHVQTNRNYRIKKLGLSVWKFFMRLKEEKQMYKMSLLRYALMKRVKNMMNAWNECVIKRQKEEGISLKIKEIQKKQRKVMLFRQLKEGASQELDFLKLIKPFRTRRNKKIYRKIFTKWIEHTQKKNVIKSLINQNKEGMNYRLLQNILLDWQYVVQRNKRDQLKLEEHVSFKQCILLSNLLKQWKRLTRILAKENRKIANIQNNNNSRLECSVFYAWCDAYQDKRFNEQTERMQRFLEKRVAFNKVIRALREQFNQKEEKRGTDAYAIRHCIQTSMRRVFDAWQWYYQKQKHKNGLKIMSNLLGKAIALKRTVKKMRVMKNYAYHSKHCFQYYILKIYSKAFNFLKQYKQFREKQRMQAIIYSESLSIQKVQKCFQYLKRNVDLKASYRLFRKKFDKKMQFRQKNISMMLWKDFYMKKRFEKTKIGGFVESLNALKLRQCFIALHHYKLSSLYRNTCKQQSGIFNAKRIKRSFFDSWKLICNEEKLMVRQSNMAFSHYSTTVKTYALCQWINFMQSQQKENNHTYNGVALRSSILKQLVFKTLKWHYTLSTKQRIVQKNHNISIKIQYLRRWCKSYNKNQYGVPAILTIISILNLAMKRFYFNKIKKHSLIGIKLSKICQIYSQNLKYNIVKVLIVNMLLERRAQDFKMRKGYQIMRNAFNALRQYSTIKRHRTFKIIQTLQNIHGLIQFNLAQKVFNTLKQYHYMKLLKRNTLIRYVDQLKLKTLLALRKYVLDNNEEGLAEHRIAAVHI